MCKIIANRLNVVKCNFMLCTHNIYYIDHGGISNNIISKNVL